MVTRALGGRHAGCRRDRAARGNLVRSRRRLSQRRAPCRRAFHAGQSLSSDVRSDDRRSQRVHAAVEDQLPLVSAHGKECAAAGIQVRAVDGRNAVRQVQEGGVMKFRRLASVVIAAAAAAVIPSVFVLAQTAAPAPAKPTQTAKTTKTWTVTKTPWGDPDLQGVWNDATSTPMQRPAGKGEAVLNEEQADQFAEQLANDLTRDRRDGRMPPAVPISPERQKIRAERAAAAARFNAGMPDVATELSLPIRCIIRTDSPPYLPTIYNNDFQIYQSPGYVVIAPEMIHSARIIPLDGRPHLGPNLKQWLGDTRGHFEGTTLVIETTNFRSDDGTVYQGANPSTYTITERFTRVDADTINYEFTIDDPKTWTKPWTAVIPWNKIDPKEQMYEYMCHEDNFDIVHLLTGARAREKNPSLNLTKPQTQR